MESSRETATDETNPGSGPRLSLRGKESPMTDPAGKDKRPQTPDDRMSRDEKEAFEDKVEEFEGPDPREVHGDEKKHSHEPGISRS